MSKAKPWPTVANRHRAEAIFKSGEITKAVEQMQHEVALLREAVCTNNIALALAISRTIEAQQRFIGEAAQAVIQTLESAPASEED